MCTCGNCSKCIATMLLVLGVLFLLRDLGIWNFWGIQWWTALLLLAGLCGLACSGCGPCEVGKSKKKK